MRRRSPAYHAVLPHVSFSGDDITPVWVNDEGRAVIAWHEDETNRTLLIGLDVVEEFVRHRQGDPVRVTETEAATKAGYGFDFERPNYLFVRQIVPEYRTTPWADYLGFFLAETLSRLSGLPLLEPLPAGCRGAVILTGDDDEAHLESYDEQLRMVGNLPMTYFLGSRTKHSASSVAVFPANVEIGVHPDALAQPAQYNQQCASDVAAIRALSKKRVRTVRNHGYLNDGYLGHLKVWEDSDLRLDVNYPGVDGTALNGSFLPMRIRRPDGTWSLHYGLLTLFGDGMIDALGMSERQAARRIRQVARQIESSHPGVIVLNLHPQNVTKTRRLHREALALAKRRGWLALDLEQYVDWVEMREGLRIESHDGRHVLSSPGRVRDLVLRWPVHNGWKRKSVEPWSHHVEVEPG